MSRMPNFFRLWLSRSIWNQQARQIWDWLQSNSNTVIVDELEQAIQDRRNWTDKDEEK